MIQRHRRDNVVLLVLASGALSASLLAAAGNEWFPRAPSILSRGCETVVAAPSSTSVLYASCAKSDSAGDLYRSTDRGLSWNRLVNGLGAVPINALAVDPTDSERLYAGTVSGEGGVFMSSDGGESWTVSVDGLPGFAIVHLIVVDPISPSVVYTVSYSGFERDGGLFRSEDGGSTWSPVGGLVHIQVLVIDPRSGSLYAGTRGEPGITAPSGLFKSNDGGRSWRRLDLGLDASDFHAQSTVAVALDSHSPQTLYVATEDHGVLRSRDGGTQWKRIDDGMPPGTSRLLVDPSRAGTVYGGGPGGVFRSVNYGATWEPLSAGLTGLPVSALTARTEEPGSEIVLYAAVENGTRAIFRMATAIDRDLLLGDRFRVSLSWRDFEGRTGVGYPQRLSDGSAGFWFFDPGNLEVTVKVLDGRRLNRAFWVFYGSLSNVEFTLTVTDIATGETRTYDNPLGTFASAGDTAAFPD